MLEEIFDKLCITGQGDGDGCRSRETWAYKRQFVRLQAQPKKPPGRKRRLGELIRAQKETVGLNIGAMGIGTSAVPQENRTPTLADAGIDKKLSSRAQKVAAVPEDEFEGMVARWRDSLERENERVTTDLLRAARKSERRAGIAAGHGQSVRSCRRGKYAVQCDL